MQANSANKILAESKELISREINLCRNLRAMISRELEAIVLDGDMDALYEILERKDEVISQLQLLADGWRDLLSEAGISNVNNSNFPEGFGKYLLTLYPNDKELPELIQESREIAESIMKAEDEAVSELDKLSSGLRGQMVNRAHGRNVAASYARMGGSII